MHKVLLLTPTGCSRGAVHVKLARVPIAGDRISFSSSEDDSDKKILYIAEVEEVILYDEISRGPHNEDVEQTRAFAHIKAPLTFNKYTSTRK